MFEWTDFQYAGQYDYGWYVGNVTLAKILYRIGKTQCFYHFLGCKTRLLNAAKRILLNS